jgi:hypothetical protein
MKIRMLRQISIAGRTVRIGDLVTVGTSANEVSASAARLLLAAGRAEQASDPDLVAIAAPEAAKPRPRKPNYRGTDGCS